MIENVTTLINNKSFCNTLKLLTKFIVSTRPIFLLFLQCG